MTKKQGFTLVELLVTIAIIGILASIIVVNISGARKQARDAKRQSELKSIQTALEQYANLNNGLYPSDLSQLSPFINPIPIDPMTGQESCSKHVCDYIYSNPEGDTTHYRLCAWMEISSNNKSDCGFKIEN